MTRKIVAAVRRRLGRVVSAIEARIERRRLPHRLDEQRIDIAAAARDKRPITVFFAPEAGVGRHFATHCLLARTLKERGERVLMVRCFDLYPRCIVMDSFSAPLDMPPAMREATCRGCAQASLRMTGEYGLDVIDLRDLVDDTAITAIRDRVAATDGDLADFEIDGVRLGNFASADAAVNFKLVDPEATGPDVRRMRERYVEGAMISLQAMQKLLRLFTVRRVVHFNEYAILMGAVMAARNAGIPIANITVAYLRAADQRRIQVIPHTLKVVGTRAALDHWPVWRKLALPAERVREFGSDLRFRMTATSTLVYSPAHSGNGEKVFRDLRLSEDRRLLVAYTSSLDELRSAKMMMRAVGEDLVMGIQPFQDQLEWLGALINYVEASDDLQLVVRIHPREGANKRDPRTSVHLGQLRERFSGAYDHVRIAWPQDPVSSYDLAELADVGLTAWTSMSVEMAKMGIPVVVAFDRIVPYPTGDFFDWSATAEGYFRLIREALAAPVSLAKIRRGFRWSNLFTLGAALDFSDIVPSSDYEGLPPFRTPRAADMVEAIFVHGKSAFEMNYAILAGQQGPERERDEGEALRAELRALIWFLCFGEERPDDYRLFFAPHGETRLPPGYDAAVARRGRDIEIRASDRLVARRSPLVGRLAELAAQNIYSERQTLASTEAG
jgi:hypothetical protein